MAFKYLRSSPPLACWSDGKNILVEEPTGKIAEYPINLGVEIPKQAVDFHAQNAYFCLDHQDTRYVGRKDGTWSGFRINDGLLIRFGSWEHPKNRDYQFIGTFMEAGYGGRRVLLDLTDERSAYVYGRQKIYVFNEKFNHYLSIPTAIGEIVANNTGLHIVTTEGEVDENAAGRWFIPSLLWKRNHPVQL